MPRRSHPLLRALLLLCTLGLIVPALASPGSATPTPAATTLAAEPDPDANPHRAQRAIEALERVQDLLAGEGKNGARSLTLELRDLALLRGQLTGVQRAQANQLLARPLRPSKSQRKCSSVICVHWQTKRQSERHGVRSLKYVRNVLRTMTAVHKKYIAAGYRRPFRDGRRGGNSKPDVYLGDIGANNLYGYCTTDDPRPPKHGGTWGFCVLDNDYSSEQFPAHTPLENMKVTAAHEYFHNVQFAHDYGEDAWFMEATATWAEDEVYDHINDNAFYLPHGPISNPLTSLDTFAYDGLFHYGTWIFIRYLTDRYGTKVAGMDDLVLDMWNGATGKDRAKYSLASVVQTLQANGTTLEAEYAKFAAGNRQPSRTYPQEYQEVAADPENKDGYPRTPLVDQFSLAPDATQGFGRSYDHLTARTVRYVPTDETGPLSMLNLTFDLADTPSGGHAVIVTKPVSGAQTQTLVTADGAAAPIPFDVAATKWVEVTIVNGSSRFDCWNGSNYPMPDYSCMGDSRDDGVMQKVSAAVTP